MRGLRRRSRARKVWASAFLVWLVLAVAVHSTDWNFTAAAIVNVAVFSVCLVLVRPLRHVRVKGFRTRWTDLALRAGLVALLVGVVVTFSFQLGPAGSGMLAVFPVVLLSIMFILHNRVGGPASAAVMANAVLGLVGFAFTCTVLHFSADAVWLGHWPDACSCDIGRLELRCTACAPSRHCGVDDDNVSDRPSA